MTVAIPPVTGGDNRAAYATVQVGLDPRELHDVTVPVWSITVEDHDRLTDEAKVVLDDPTGVLAHALFEGLVIRIDMGRRMQHAPLFEGVVVSSVVQGQPAGQRIQLTARDYTHRLAQTPFDPRTWATGEPLSALLRRLVLAEGTGITEGTIEPVDDTAPDSRGGGRYVAASVWDFILHEAQNQGCLAYVELDKDLRSRFSFRSIESVAAAEPVGTLRYCRVGSDLVSFTYERISSGAVPDRSASTVDPDTGKLVDQPTPPRPPRLPPAAPQTGRDPDLPVAMRAAVTALTGQTAAAQARLTAPAERVVGRAAGSAQDARNRVRADPTRIVGMSGRGRAVGNVLLRAKAMLRITGLAPWAEGAWYLARVTHVYTRDLVGDHQDTSYFTDITATR
ncbi:hypothetical protein [Streptomyces humi]|uniref:hypothetical protein n=1 Tax=Streptomyces humi TaxID=1428620 RepID=UPI00062879DF|nr:hypothetical protein [Streptomyces humi]